jgi:hypothetical protein
LLLLLVQLSATNRWSTAAAVVSTANGWAANNLGSPGTARIVMANNNKPTTLIDKIYVKNKQDIVSHHYTVVVVVK